MITLSHGVKKPEDGDKGTLPFSAINSNFQILNDHTHNGTDSAAIPASAIAKGTINLVAASWIATGDGIGHKQTVNMPGVYTLANSQMRFRVTSGAHIGKIIHPTILPLSLTQFEVVVNDSSLNLEILLN